MNSLKLSWKLGVQPGRHNGCQQEVLHLVLLYGVVLSGCSRVATVLFEPTSAEADCLRATGLGLLIQYLETAVCRSCSCVGMFVPSGGFRCASPQRAALHESSGGVHWPMPPLPATGPCFRKTRSKSADWGSWRRAPFHSQGAPSTQWPSASESRGDHLLRAVQELGKVQSNCWHLDCTGASCVWTELSELILQHVFPLSVTH